MSSVRIFFFISSLLYNLGGKVRPLPPTSNSGAPWFAPTAAACCLLVAVSCTPCLHRQMLHFLRAIWSMRDSESGHEVVLPVAQVKAEEPFGSMASSKGDFREQPYLVQDFLLSTPFPPGQARLSLSLCVSYHCFPNFSSTFP